MKNNNELNEGQQKIVDELYENIAKKDKEKEEKKQKKEEERQARREARRKKREERPFILNVLSVAGQWLVVLAVLVWLGTGAGKEFAASLNGETTYKEVVLESEVNGVTVESACKYFLKDFKTTQFENDGLNVVQITGKALVNNVESDIMMQFLVNDRTVGDYTLYTSSINNIVQDKLNTQNLFNTICNSYANHLDSIQLDDVQANEAEDIQVGKEEDTATVMNSKYSFNSSTNKSVNKDNCIQLIKSSDYKGKKIGSSLDNYYDTTDWSFVSKDGNTYRVDMTADCDTEMYRIKITFVIDSKGNIGIDNAVMSSLDSTDAYSIDDEELNAILDQVF